MQKVALMVGLVLAVLGAALVPLPGPGYPVVALGLVVASAAAISMQLRHSKRS